MALSPGEIMKKITLLSFISIFIAGVLTSGAVFSATVQINLNDFSPIDPSDPVIISADGSSATISEDSALFSVILVNDPFFGDPNVILPGASVSLKFDFNFDEPVANSDEFGAFLFDAETGFTPDPASSFEFFTESPGSGTISFDLSSLTALTLGLQFQLSSLPGDAGFDSSVIISNVRLVTIPIPSAILLFGSALISLAGLRLKSQ
jgi:hypothetical protein